MQTIFNPNLECSGDNLITDILIPRTLKILCLQFLHKNVNHCISIKENIHYYNFVHAEKQISLLEIPKALKTELITLNRNCRRHFRLRTAINHHDTRVVRLILKKGSQLSQFLCDSPSWDNNNNNKLWAISDLLNELESVPEILVGRTPLIYFDPKIFGLPICRTLDRVIEDNFIVYNIRI